MTLERKRPDATVPTVKQQAEEMEKDQIVEGVVNRAERGIKEHWKIWKRNQSDPSVTYPDEWLYDELCEGSIWLDNFGCGVFAHYNPWHWESEDIDSFR